MAQKKTPHFELRSGAVDALHFVVKTTDLDTLRTELARRFDATPEFFAGDGVAIDLRRLDAAERLPLEQLAALLGEFRMHPIGVVGQPAQREWVEPCGLPWLESRDKRGATELAAAVAGGAEGAATTSPVPLADLAAAAAAVDPAAAARHAASGNVRRAPMVVDRPLRSGQQIYSPGDLIVLGLVSNGAEIIAEGNIYVYAPLRGRVLAGVPGNVDARIFCTCLEPELIAVAGVYRTAENPLPAELRGKPAQIRLEAEKLIIEPLRLT